MFSNFYILYGTQGIFCLDFLFINFLRATSNALCKSEIGIEVNTYYHCLTETSCGSIGSAVSTANPVVPTTKKTGAEFLPLNKK